MKLSPKHTRKISLLLASLMVLSVIYIYKTFNGNAPSTESSEIKQLIDQSIKLRYRDLKQSENNIQKAIKLSTNYPDEKARALIELADINCLKGDINSAKAELKNAGQITNNIIIHFKSRVGMLKVCQLASANIDFYNNLYEAQNDLKRIKEEYPTLNTNIKKEIEKAEVEMHLTCAEYFSSIQQIEKSNVEFEKINPDDLESVNLQLRLNYSMGRFGFRNNPNKRDVEIFQFEQLSKCIIRSSVHEENLPYLLALSKMALAELICDKNTLINVKRNRNELFRAVNINDTPDSLVAYSVAEDCVKQFQELKNPYLEGIAYCTLAKCQFDLGNYIQALQSLTKSLKLVNKHHQKFNGINHAKCKLTPYYKEESIAEEIRWINNSNVYSIPEWIAMVRERLSLTYSALNEKKNSDYNRNIYLDILEITREDKMLESRYNHLKGLSTKSTALLWGVFIFFVIFLMVLIRITILWGKRYKKQTERLHEILELCHKISTREINANYVEYVDPETKEMLKPFSDWIDKYEENIEEIYDESINFKKQHQIYVDKLHKNQQDALHRNTVISLANNILTYIDRLLYTIKNIKKGNTYNDENIEYSNELIARIESENEQLTKLISINRGQIKLNIQSFELDSLFSILEKSRQNYTASGVTLKIDHTDIICKADYALTMFMINTLASNAKKFTPKGGTVYIYAKKEEDYVEISIEDDGIGISKSDIEKLLDNKVYKSEEIGTSSFVKDSYKNAKGFGFGIMNCKGIINQYKNSSPLMSVCKLGIESIIGKGSRFYFRLPIGIKKTFILIAAILSTISGFAENNYHLQKASQYADSAYYSNVNRDYKKTLEYANTSITELNEYYKQSNDGTLVMKLFATGYEPEIYWYKKGLYTDYHVILDIRNEISIAALALHKWKLYEYNNDIYTKLFRLVFHDNQLEEFCKKEEKAKTVNTICVLLLFGITIILIAVFYTMYLYPKIRNRSRLRLVSEIGHKLLETSQKMPNNADENERLKLLILIVNKYLSPTIAISSCNIEIGDNKFTFQEENANLTEKTIIDLKISNNQPFGALEFSSELPIDQNNKLILELITQQFAACTHQSIVMISKTKEDRELSYDEMNRADWEQQQIYVNNQILDNSLSTIKHETMYYPTQIKQQLNKFTNKNIKTDLLYQELIELTEYYRNLFFLLVNQANYQAKNTLIKPAIFNEKKLEQITYNVVKKINKKTKKDIQLNYTNSNSRLKIYADPVLIEYLYFCIFNEICSTQEQTIPLSIEIKNDIDKFVKIIISSAVENYSYNQDSLNIMLATEIIREHDEQCRRGCKFEFENNNKKIKFWFTLPIR